MPSGRSDGRGYRNNIWTYCHRSICPEAQRGRPYLTRINSQRSVTIGFPNSSKKYTPPPPYGILRQAVLVRIFPRMSNPTGCYYAAYRAKAQVCLVPSQRPLACVQVSAFQHFPSCLMYAGFKHIAPEQDTGMDLNEPWITSLEFFNAWKHS